MKNIFYFNFILFEIFLFIESTKFIKVESQYGNNQLPSIDSPEHFKVCKFECDKLSKVYPCFCDISCIEYGDCCKLFALGCGNYFEFLLNSTQKFNEYSNKNQNKSSAKFLGKNENSFIKASNITNKTLNNTLGENIDHNGRCCLDGAEPFNCFCDGKCINNGDCCSDYDHCFNKFILSEKKIEMSTRKRRSLENINKRKNKNEFYYEKHNQIIEKPLKENKEYENFNFFNLKNMLYDKITNKVDDFIRNLEIKNNNKSSEILKEKSGGNRLKLYKVNTLTPQLEMIYLDNNISIKKEKKLSNSLNYEKSFIKKSPVPAKIRIEKILLK